MNDADKFIIGIDLGNHSSVVSYMDFDKKSLEVIDISGGYGKISIPTVLSYNMDTKDWVFGEYAILNRGFSNEIIIENIVEKLGTDITFNIENKQKSISYILSKFIEYLLESIKNINPNAKIEGIVLSISSYINDEITKDIQNAFSILGIEELLISIANDKECILKSYFYQNDMIGDKALIIDYSNRQVRANLYDIKNRNNLKCIKASFKEDIAEGKIFNKTKDLILKKFIEETGKLELTDYERLNLDTFVYQQFDIIFQRQIISDIKLYYNFYYPPFQKILTKNELFSIMINVEKELNSFFNKLFEDLDFKEKEIKNVILCGGGIEIDFIHRYIKSRFCLDKNFKTKAKRIVSDGAVLIGAREIGIIKEDNLQIEDLEKLSHDIGVFMLKEEEKVFVPLAYKNSFIWQKFDKKVFLIESKKIEFSIAIKNSSEDYNIINNICIDLGEEFLERDIKTIRLLLEIDFKSNKEFILRIEDFGFGEIFPKTSFKREIYINL